MSQNPQSVEERVITVLRETIDLPADVSVDITATLIDGFELDELDLVVFCVTLEEEFGIEIPDESFQEWITVQDAIEYIRLAVPASPQNTDPA